MPFTLGAFIGLILGTVLMLFLWAACENNKERKAEKTGIIEFHNGFFRVIKIKEENKNEQN